MDNQITAGFFKNNYYSAIVIFIVFSLASCSYNPSKSLAKNALNSMVKSENDRRQYQRLRLENSLDILLISDPETDKAAVAMDLYMGSYQNPSHREGLAHFLEHMLFLGTKQYPAADEYQTFISEHGGSHNASTGLEHTNYFFDVDADYLDDALDRFAPFFTDPLFDASYVDRERNAVESEYRLKYKNDSRRQWDVIREIINSKHPLSKFTVGNLQTLADNQQSDIRKELINLYDKYYSANLMKLVVLGKQPIEQLQSMVSQRFSSIENKQVQISPYRAPFIEPSRLPMQVNFRPLKDSRELSLLFELPKLEAYWQIKPGQYLASMIGYEGQGSLLQALKDKGWADSLSAGVILEDRGAGLFSIDIGLTPQGYEAREQILIELFAWLKLIREKGIQGWRQLEYAAIGDMQFRFAEKQDPAAYATYLAAKMHRYSGSELLRAPYVSNVFDRSVIEAIAAQLTPSKMLLFVAAPDIDVKAKSKYYQTDYWSKSLDSKFINRLEAAIPTLQLSLAGKNPYIPEDLDLIDSKSGRIPKLIQKKPGLRVWYHQNAQFGVPKAQIIISLGSDLTASLNGLSAAELYVTYLRDQLNDRLYPALTAGLTYSIGATEQGITINIGGYSDNQALLLQEILTELADPVWDRQRFELIKQQLVREKNNSKRDYPFRQVISSLYSAIEGRWSPIEQASSIQSIGMAQLQVFVSQLLSGFDGKVLINGNHGKNTANAIIKQLDSMVFEPRNIVTDVAKLPQKDSNSYLKVDHQDSVLIQYMQGDEASLGERARMSLISHMISAPFYNQLRTERQLGYVVSAFPFHSNRVPGICTLVQSPVASEQALQEEFKAFNQRFSVYLEQLDRQELERHKTALLVNLEEKPENLTEMTARLSQTLSLGYENFDFRSQLAVRIRALTVDDIQQAYDRLIIKNPRRLWLQTLDKDGSSEGANTDRSIDQRYRFPY